jgi:hypothetical protein
MVVSEITLYNVLKTKFGETEAQVVVECIKQEIKDEFDNKKDVLSTKEDILNLRIDMEKGFRENLKWTVATILACTGILLAILKMS